jgi:hypothetical protein|nr:MAG TPA: hypothetical protein [Caudoviricetes sp.]
MDNIVNIAFVDLVEFRGRWVATAFMHATDCEFSIKSNSTDPSTTIRELMRTVRHVQKVTLALRSWQEGRITFTRCTYSNEIDRYAITYSDSSDDSAYVCTIVVSEHSEDSIEIVPGEKPALALEAEAILSDKGYTVHAIKEDEDGGLPQWLR